MMSESVSDNAAERWITFREDIKVFDCTIRDGGLMNDHKFEDDVVQRTWVRALTSPPRDSGHLRQWLASVAHNLARDHQRSSARRSRYEGQVLPGDESPSVADVVHRDDVRMIEHRHRLGFPGEARPQLGTVGPCGELGGQQLHRDLPLQPQIARRKDGAHAAFSDHFAELQVIAEGRDRQRAIERLAGFLGISDS